MALQPQLYTNWPDNSKITLGNSNDLQLLHNATNSYIQNYVGDLYINNWADDKDIIFQSDDGSGGTTEYFRVDGSSQAIIISKATQHGDNVKAYYGAGNDLQIYHDGSFSRIDADGTGDLIISQKTADKDIIFVSDDGSGGETTYFKLDGSATTTVFSKDTRHIDNAKALFGGNNDFKIYHDGTDSVVQNETGDLEFQNRQNDGDIKFKSDDGSGGVTEYFRLDGSVADGTNLVTRFPDQSILVFGSGSGFQDGMQIYHNGTNSFVSNYVGDLEIRQETNDGDIVFKSDDGSGGTTAYITLDGSHTKTIMGKTVHFDDNVKIQMGNYASPDLQIYHDGSNSFVADTGTGGLFLEGNSEVRIRKQGTSEIMLQCVADGAVNLYHNNVKKFETKTNGVNTTYSVTGNTDGTHAGDIVHLGETTTVAGKIYHYKSDGAWELVDADAASTCDGLLAVALGTSSNTNGMLLRGMITLDHDPGAVGDTLFASTTAGQATATAPSGSGDIVRVIGYCLNASNGQIWFNPDGAFVEVA